MINKFTDRRVSRLDAEIWSLYEARKHEIRRLAKAGDYDACMAAIDSLIGFIGRFRNCDLRFYYDEEIHRIIAGMNPRRFDTSDLLMPKKEFRIAFVFSRFNDMGGAAFTHRYILERPVFDGISIKQYVLVTNEKDPTSFEQRERYRYMCDRIEFEEFGYVPAGGSVIDDGQFIETWLHEREIDFAMFQPSLSTLYALSSQPTLISATFSADWHCYTIGPGIGDFTFLMTTDQVYKYRYDELDFDRRIKTIMLPLPPQDYIDAAEPLSKAELGVPEDAVVSATTNMWKCCFGDDEALLTGIATLVRRFPRYHHLFVGTPRALDNVESFLARNPDLRENIHYIGPVPYIYKLLKSIDFYVNSYPVSGASNTEAAMVGKPSIDLFASRDLAGHGTELQRSHECEAINLDEFVRLGSKFIEDAAYRVKLGTWLKAKIRRDLDKGRIAREKIYETFLLEFDRRLHSRPPLPALRLDDTLEYEKFIALYNVYGRQYWPPERRRCELTAQMDAYPERPFAFIKTIEEVIVGRDREWLETLARRLTPRLLDDYRIRTLLALAWLQMGEEKLAKNHALAAHSLNPRDINTMRIVDYLLARDGRDKEAPRAFSPAENAKSQDGADIIPAQMVPLYYDY